MSLFDNIFRGMSGKTDQGGLARLFGGSDFSLGGLLQSLTGSGGTGGLTSLIQRFTNSGQGDTVNSWVGTGPNKPITPEAIRAAVGEEKIAAFAQRHGISVPEAEAALAKILPEAVDKMTPNGRVEDGIV